MSQAEPILLHPNIGAEENRKPKRAAAEIRSLPVLWKVLFGERARLPEETDAPDHSTPRIAARFDRFESACFPQIGDLNGLVPWYSDPGSESLADRSGQRYGAPPSEVVRRVHDKAFSLRTARSHGCLPNLLAGTVTILEPELFADPEDAARRIEATVACWPDPLGQSFTVKPRIGTSGRGRVSGRDGRLQPSSVRGLARFADRGGAILEPWLDRRLDLSTQLWIDRSGAVEVIGTTVQILSPNGLYHGNRGRFRGPGPVGSGQVWDTEISTAAQKIAESAASEGFWGPCGVDSFVYYDPDHEMRLRPIVELNARFTTGTIALGFLERARELDLVAGNAAWCFALHPPSGGWHPDADRRPGRLISLLEGEADGPALLLSPQTSVVEYGW